MNREFLKKSKILIVDDNEANIDVLKGLLEFEGYESVISTTDSRTVVQLCSGNSPDLILLDLMMPYLNGFEIMELLSKKLPNDYYLPILVLTADASDETKKKALANGATDFLAKPFDLVEVALRVENLLYISFLNKQLLNQNNILDAKVKERTKELELQNTELKLAWEKADAGDKLKTAFINNISHEIRTPLNGIIGFSQLITELELSEKERFGYLQFINESSERLINTVTNFLDISLLTSGNVELNLGETSPDSILGEVYEKLVPFSNKKGIGFEMEMDPEVLTPIVTDEVLLYKIIFQIAENAIKFTNTGSVKLSCKRENNSVVYFIQDTGVGIADENKDQIFNIFFQEQTGHTRNFEGSGLGLSIAKGMIDLLGGKIGFESVKGEGTMFYVSVPCSDVEGENNCTEDNLQDLNNKTRHKILVVEDDEVNCHYLRVLLSPVNFELVWATNGFEAVELIEKNPEIKIVLMDLKLPLMDGYEATQKIKAINNKLPVIAVTAYSESDDRKKAAKAGCDEFVIKPIQKSVLFEKLRKYISF